MLLPKFRMAKEDLDKLGLSSESSYTRVVPSVTSSKEGNGFIAGTGVKTSGKWGWN